MLGIEKCKVTFGFKYIKVTLTERDVSHNMSRVAFYVAKTKALISCAIIAQLICAFVYAYAKTAFLMTRLI